MEVEVARRLAEHERQQEAERQRVVEMLQVQPAPEAPRASLPSRDSMGGEQPTPSDGASRSHAEEELRQRLQDLEDRM